MWVYWVMPTLLVATILLPRERRVPLAACPPVRTGRVIRLGLVTISISMVALMGIYTIDRLASFTNPATQAGVRLNDFQAVQDFLFTFMRRVLGDAQWCVWLIPVGAWVLSRSALRWWLWVIVASGVIIIAFALINGSAGYVRNLTFLLMPLAMLIGLGVDRLFEQCVLKLATRRFRKDVVSAVLITGFAATGVWAYPRLQPRVRALLPDWGQAAQQTEHWRQPFKLRWFCPSLAHHWQIDWYRKASSPDEFMQLSIASKMEVVFATQRDEFGQAEVFRSHPIREIISEDPLPTYLASIAPYTITKGIELRRWQATRISLKQTKSHDEPLLILVDLKHGRMTFPAWQHFCDKTRCYEKGVIDFKALPGQEYAVWSLLAPASTASALIHGIEDNFFVAKKDVRLFSLTPMTLVEVGS